MKVTLAGCNVDRGLLDELTAAGGASGRPPLSPETISAAYARISRDPRPVGELRRIARTEVAAARRSNRRIVYDMGHASIAEHAVFNLDVEGISRLAAEALEGHRLASFTEKSQRYIVLEADHVIPAEIAGGPVEAGFRALVARQASLYADLMAALAGRGSPPESAREDARYALPLAAATQLGMTANARTLELIVRRLAASPLAELRALGAEIHAQVSALAPSLLRHVEPVPGELRRPAELAELAAARGAHPAATTPASPGGGALAAVRLIEASAEPDRRVHFALLYPAAGRAAAELGAQLAGLSDEEVGRDIRRVLADLGPHDPAPRAFETAGFLFEVVLSASAYAQLKRHRMTTQLAADYQPELGPTVPETVARAGLAGRLAELAEAAAAVASEIGRSAPAAAAYALMNAHRRRVLVAANARELYHLARLRMDSHAQWEIRELVGQMVELARRAAPHTLCLACGKDQFGELKRRWGSD